ncbi:MAG TPA: histidine kinase N-terminal domain-containing protein [Marmoricola sp.]|nr:histidine kinase N-terminal domain-containing protein [Marmoricola sp.]
MPTLSDIAHSHTELGAADVEWLRALVADWQIIADLSFADLVLWLPDARGKGFWAAAQMRPTTGPTAHLHDLVGTFVSRTQRPLLVQAWEQGRVSREGDPEWRDDVPVRVEAIPVRRNSEVIAVVARNTNLTGVRTSSRLELSYLQAATELFAMIASGSFPFTAQRSDLTDTPRVGDGFIRVDKRGEVSYASPNAQSVYRRLGLTGDLAGHSLAEVTRELVPDQLRTDEEVLSAVLSGRAPRDTEVGNAMATIIARSVPLRPSGEHAGAIILVRDVTDLRRRDRELVTKDATIREIHHRVKNNLQTVAALLRLQARRLNVPEGRLALEEAVRRVGAIAVVHETLSQNFDEWVDFDEVCDQLTRLVTDVGTPDTAVTTRRSGSFAMISSDVATPLAMVLTELMQNAVEHGFGSRESGTITLQVARHGSELSCQVIDDGSGLPVGFDLSASPSLGLSIVRTLVGELGGTVEITDGEQGGTVVSLRLPDVERAS